MKNNKKIILDEIAKIAINEIENTNNIFMLKGPAGTGKTTLINECLRRNIERPEKEQFKIKILATTGAAATQYEMGCTYHSFFKIRGERLSSIKKDEKDIINYYDKYLIDESSMISASQYDLIDQRLRQCSGINLPMGGKQIIFVGDFLQASPVVTDYTKQFIENKHGIPYNKHYKSIYFFDAKTFDIKNFKIIELKKYYRQTDITLQTYLKHLQLGTNKLSVCKFFNKKYTSIDKISNNNAVYLSNTNKKVNTYNETKLNALKTNGATIYISKATWSNWYNNGYGKIIDEPSPQEIKYCVGSRIIFNTNTEYFKNGTMGTITNIGIEFNEELNKDYEILDILIDGDDVPIKIEVNCYKRYEETIIGKDDDGNNIIENKIVGYYFQFPFQLGFALTSFKAQGKTFDHVIVDFHEMCYKDAKGNWVRYTPDHLLYVMISRVTSFEGINIINYLTPNFISINERVKEMNEYFNKK